MTEKNYSGEVDASPWGPYYFVVFICFGSFFFLNLFIAVIFERFMEIKRNTLGSGLLTDRQRDWVDAQIRLRFVDSLCSSPLLLPQVLCAVGVFLPCPPFTSSFFYSRVSCPQPEVVPSSKFRRFFFRIAVHSLFDWFILICIGLNVLSLTLIHDVSPDSHAQNVLFLYICLTGYDPGVDQRSRHLQLRLH